MKNVMNNVAIIALRSMYSADIVDILGDLIVNSINPRVALEVALAIYELPDLTMGKEFLNSKENIQFISFDRFKECVTFSYNKVNIKYAWTNNKTGMVVSTQESSYYAKDAVNMQRSEFEETHTRAITESVISDKVIVTDTSLDTWVR